MKKIVGILGMAAMLSASAFALDVSASLKIEGSLLNVNEDGKVNAFKTNTGTPTYGGLSFAVAGDVAGASFNLALKDAKVKTAGDGKVNGDWGKVKGDDFDVKVIDFTGSDGKIWVKPFANALNNALTLNVGKVGALSAGKYGVGGDVGFLADYNNTDMGLNVAFVMNSLWYEGQAKKLVGGDGDPVIKDEAYLYQDGKLGLFGAKVAYKNDSIGSIAAALSYNDAANKAFQLALGYTSAEFIEGLTFGADFYMQTAEDYRNKNAVAADENGLGKKDVVVYNLFRDTDTFGVNGTGFSNKMNIAVNAKYALADLGLTFSTAEEFVFGQDYDEYLRATYFSTKAPKDESVENKLALNLVKTNLTVAYAKDLIGLDLGFNADFITASGDNMDKAMKAKKIDLDANDKVINEKISAKFTYKEPKFFTPTVEVAVEGFLGNYGWGKADGANNATYFEDDMTVKINAGVSGKIGACDWTLGMNNTITNYKADDENASKKDPNGANRGAKYSLDIPFTMSVAF